MRLGQAPMVRVGRALAIAAIGVATAAAPTVADAAYPGRNGRIALDFEQYGVGRIATMRPDGTGLRMLTPDVYPGAGLPWWSADGERLYFTGFEDLSPLYVMAADGSGRAVVPHVTADYPWDRSLSRDERHVLYTRSFQVGGMGDSYAEIRVASLHGFDDRRLAAGELARWSPDGRRIAYVASQEPAGAFGGDDRGTWLMRASNGMRARRLTRLNATSIDWSPNGRRLVVSVNGDVFLLRRGGGRKRRLTATPNIAETHVAWSPDGRKIAFTRTRATPSDDEGGYSNHYSIWTMNTRGEQQQRIWSRPPVSVDADLGPPRLSWQPRPR